MRAGRAEFLAQFPSLAGAEAQAVLPDPADRLTFERSQLDLGERERHAGPMPSTSICSGCGGRTRCSARRAAAASTAPCSAPEAFVLRFFGIGVEPDDRLLCVNLGRDLILPTIAEPLLAPPEGTRWRLVWSSEAVRYGGAARRALDPADGWVLPGHAAVVFGPAR